jgi:hypothetical protein
MDTLLDILALDFHGFHECAKALNLCIYFLELIQWRLERFYDFPDC